MRYSQRFSLLKNVKPGNYFASLSDPYFIYLRPHSNQLSKIPSGVFAGFPFILAVELATRRIVVINKNTKVRVLKDFDDNVWNLKHGASNIWSTNRCKCGRYT